MSLTPETMLELMALADGELEGHARARVEKLVAESEEARRVVDAMRAPELGAWLAEAVDARAGAADGIADAVMAKLASSPAHRDRDSDRDRSGAPGHEDGGVVRLAATTGRRISRVQVAVAAAVGAMALAAGIAVIARVAGREEMSSAPVAPVLLPSAEVQGAPAGSSAVAQQNAVPRESVEVDEIDSPSRGVSVFEIPLRSAAAAAGPVAPSSVVIWIDDEPGAK
jgi:hypothetical protein